jgi:hypothetical protein
MHKKHRQRSAHQADRHDSDKHRQDFEDDLLHREHSPPGLNPAETGNRSECLVPPKEAQTNISPIHQATKSAPTKKSVPTKKSAASNAV